VGQALLFLDQIAEAALRKLLKAPIYILAAVGRAEQLLGRRVGKGGINLEAAGEVEVLVQTAPLRSQAAMVERGEVYSELYRLLQEMVEVVALVVPAGQTALRQRRFL
jgi:hypothetical protein